MQPFQTGLDIDKFAPRLSFFFNCHNDFFEEVAKFRAARKLWHDLVEQRYDSNNPKVKNATISHPGGRR